MSTPRERPPGAEMQSERPSHPPVKAALLLVGALIVVLLLAALSTFGPGG